VLSFLATAHELARPDITSRAKQNLGSPKAPQVQPILEQLEGQLQAELDVTPLVALSQSTRTAGTSDAVGTTLLRLDKWSAEPAHVDVFSCDVLVVVIEYVVELSTELQADPLGEMEVLVEIHIEIPVAGPKELIPFWVGLAIGRVDATDMEQSAAGRISERDALVIHNPAGVGQRYVVKQVWRPRRDRRSRRRNRSRRNPKRAGGLCSVIAVVDAERRPTTDTEDGAQTPATQQASGKRVVRTLHPRNFPSSTEGKAIPNIKICIAII
jgi:hypothetical protein